MNILQEDIPLFNLMQARMKHVEKDLLFIVGGGLGDQVCAEPTIRYAIKNFRDATVSIVCANPEIFRHLKLKDVYHLNDIIPDKYLRLHTFPHEKKLSNQYMSSLMSNTVDYCSVQALRRQLPPAARIIKLEPPSSTLNDIKNLAINGQGILMHPGKSWASKTLPAEFWEKTVQYVRKSGKTAIIIGKKVNDQIGYVDFDATGAIDLRDKLDILDFMWLCKSAWHLITNDSAPLHIASSSHRTKIAYISTCKHPDLLLHWRLRGFAWGMANFATGGQWQRFDGAPYVLNESIADVSPELMKKWLPDPQTVVDWVLKPSSL